MKTAVYYGPYDVRIEERPVPVPGPNQMLVKIDYCGICGTDMESYKRTGLIPPVRVFGHENVGTVAALGEGVAGFRLGDHVLCGPPTHCEEDCTPCQNGQTNLCLNGLGHTAGLRQFDGGYAEYMLVHNVAHTMLIKVEEGTDLKEAVLFDVVCVAFHAIRRSKFRLGDNVVVSGVGPIGLSAIRLLKAAGANRIVALGTTNSKFDLIREYGADYVLNPNETPDLKSALLDIFQSDVAADVVFECAGNNNSIENCVYHCVRPGGQVMLVGTSASPLSGLIPNKFSVHEVDFNTSFVYTPAEVRSYLQMLKAGKLNFSGMVTDVISLDNCVEKGLDRKDRSGQLKILIAPSL